MHEKIEKLESEKSPVNMMHSLSLCPCHDNCQVNNCDTILLYLNYNIQVRD
jgi:hypothetical protein